MSIIANIKAANGSSVTDSQLNNYDRVLTDGEIFNNGFTVPAGETWGFDQSNTVTVQSAGNVIVEGTLVIEPETEDQLHTLEFINVDESQFVGGHTDVPLATDVGLWVIEDGILQAVGAEKAGWNRSGTDPTWSVDDEILVAPQTQGFSSNFVPYDGSPLPSVVGPDGVTYTTEVFNTTRNVRIIGGGSNAPEVLTTNGRGHIIFLLCNQPQTMRNVEIRYMGPRQPDPNDGSDGRLGRYSVHFHQCGDGSRGSLIENVIVRDSGNHSFVPHASHGVTLRNTVVYDVWESAYWWDPDTETEDTLIDHAASFLTRNYPTYRGFNIDGFTLGEGRRNTLTNSVAVANLGEKVNAGGFHWPSKANQGDNLWVFENNIAHSNDGAGVSSWQNDGNPHVLSDFVSYYNRTGISHGAYTNQYTYRDAVVFGNTGYDIEMHALVSASKDHLQQLWENILVGGNILLARHNVASLSPVIVKNVDIRGKVIVDERNRAGIFNFISESPQTDLQLSDFDIRNKISEITVTNSDGSNFSL